jgi:hypothetical protein
MFLRRAFTSILLPIVLLGCASQAQHLRSQPVLYMDITGDSNRMVEVLLPPIEDSIALPATPGNATPVASNDRHAKVTVASLDLEKIAAGASVIAPTPTTTTRTVAVPTAQPAKLVIRCVRTPEFYNKDTTTRSQCLYEALDFENVLNLPVRNQTERNRIIDLLASISERNCRTFRGRVFANKAALDATKNTGQDIAAGLAAGTVKAAAGLSTSLGIFNIIGGSAITNINQVIFSDKTFNVISAAIDAERAKWKTTLNLNRRSKFEDYSYQAALDDFQNFDLACSIDAALNHLGALAEDDKRSQVATLMATRGNELDQLHQELDNARKEREADQDLLKQAQRKLLDTTDQNQREALAAQIKDLREQVTTSTNALRALQSSIHAATTTPETPTVAPPVAPSASPTMPTPKTTPAQPNGN